MTTQNSQLQLSTVHLEEEYLVLLFQRQCEPIDDGSQNLQQFSHAIVPLCLVYKVVEDVVDLFPNICSQSQELAIYPVQSRLEEISLSRVL